MRVMRLLWLMPALLLVRCAATPALMAPPSLADAIKAAGQDPATACGSIMTPYGNMKFARTNITNGDVTCNQDGLTVRSQPPVIPVGVQVIPR